MIIALSGFAQAGKDSCGKYLVEKYGFQRVAFATKLKDIARDLFNVDVGESHGELDERERWILIQLGKQMREIEPLVWLLYALKDVDLEKDNIVITDCRFWNEAEFIRSWDGIVVRVVRDDQRTPPIKDISETELMDYKFDYEIHAESGDLEKLYEQLDEIMLIANC